VTDAALAIQTSGLTKRFGDQVAVGDVDLAVPRGAVFGFLGPNGSGKTTTIRMLLGLAHPTSGDIRVLDRPMPTDAATVLPRVGALVEGPGFYPWLSGTTNLARFDSADPLAPSGNRRARVAAALERVGLSAAAGKRVGAYSLGMRQRLGLASALLMPRDLLILDEPTNGLDPQGTREIRTLVRELAAEGSTVFVSSHLLSEIEQMCSHAAVMSAGRLVAHGTLEQLRSATGAAVARILTPDRERADAALRSMGLVGTDAADALTAPLGATAPEAVVAALVAAGVRVRGFTVETPSLEQRFVELTGEGFDVER
jgi:ABC-2 type transport system ATP-binding protein